MLFSSYFYTCKPLNISTPIVTPSWSDKIKNLDPLSNFRNFKPALYKTIPIFFSYATNLLGGIHKPRGNLRGGSVPYDNLYVPEENRVFEQIRLKNAQVGNHVGRGLPLLMKVCTKYIHVVYEWSLT